MKDSTTIERLYFDRGLVLDLMKSVARLTALSRHWGKIELGNLTKRQFVIAETIYFLNRPSMMGVIGHFFDVINRDL